MPGVLTRMNVFRLTAQQKDLLKHITTPETHVGSESPDDFRCMRVLAKRGILRVTDDLTRGFSEPFMIAKLVSKDVFQQLVQQEVITPREGKSE